MSSLRRWLSVVTAAVVVLQPAIACCGVTNTAPKIDSEIDSELASEAAPAQPETHATAAEHDHCGDPPPALPDNSENHCECGDGCASAEARTPKAPDATVLPAGGEAEPTAVVSTRPTARPIPSVVFARGVPPPPATPFSRPTLVSLKRLLLI